MPIKGHACSSALFLGGSQTEIDLCSDEDDPLKCGEKMILYLSKKRPMFFSFCHFDSWMKNRSTSEQKVDFFLLLYTVNVSL